MVAPAGAGMSIQRHAKFEAVGNRATWWIARRVVHGPGLGRMALDFGRCPARRASGRLALVGRSPLPWQGVGQGVAHGGRQGGRQGVGKCLIRLPVTVISLALGLALRAQVFAGLGVDVGVALGRIATLGLGRHDVMRRSLLQFDAGLPRGLL